jgi:hypothetical protein
MPSLPVSRDALDGEHVAAAEWKSINLIERLILLVALNFEQIEITNQIVTTL